MSADPNRCQGDGNRRYTAPMPIPRLELEDTALIIIDVQEKLIPSIVDADRVVRNCAILLQMARELGIPAVVTEQNVGGLGRTVQEIADALPDPSSRVEKTTFSAMVDLVAEMLQEHRRGTVIVAGLEGHVCVLQTVLDLQAAGRQVFVCTDATSSGQREQIGYAYERMRAAGAVLTGVVSAMYELIGDCSHPSFKACLGLAKSVAW